jgi:hypothetical protein
MTDDSHGHGGGGGQRSVPCPASQQQGPAAAAVAAPTPCPTLRPPPTRSGLNANTCSRRGPTAPSAVRSRVAIAASGGIYQRLPCHVLS